VSKGGLSRLLPVAWQQLAALVVTLVAAAVVAKVSFFSPNSSTGPAKSVAGDVSGLDVWLKAPTTYKFPALSASLGSATVAAGDLVALTPKDVWAHGADYEDKPVYLVGRVLVDRTLKTRYAPHHEIKLRGYTDGYIAYLATDSRSLAAVRSGDIVYALGYVAATGRIVDESAGVYFVAPSMTDAGLVANIKNRNAVWIRAQTAVKSEP
jgi:hypothetical protein